ncbi:MAG: hypothetical protein IMF19_06625 [Proteobacteria bacterium]|nr:hypothetical protein [Pseudomonadota bacterium]
MSTPMPEIMPENTFPPGYDGALVRNYELVKTEDISIKALDKPLSASSASEIENLPLNIRKTYRIVVPSDITKEELKATLIQVVMAETSKNPDIDEVTVFAYDRKEDADSFYTFGRVEWCPNGDWGGVTSQIALTNDRSSYEYIFDIKDKVGNIDLSNMPTDREFEIHTALYKAIFAEPEVPEEIIKERVAKEYGISTEELKKIYDKVWYYKMG